MSTIRVPTLALRLKFTRKDWSGCTRQLVCPALDVRRTLVVTED